MEHQIPLFDQYLMHLGASIPPHAMVDLVDVIFLTVALTVVDIGLRLLYECIEYNRATNREGTIGNLFIALIWRGWQPVNGKRYLVSKKLRKNTIEKLVKTHVVLLLLAVVAYLIPDRITVFGVQVDEFTAHVFMMLPLLFELSSIIEKIQMIDPDGVKALGRVVNYINEIRKG